MIFLLDESNIHRQDGVSSIALVRVESLTELEKLDELVLATEQNLHMTRPFHWNSTNWPRRISFTGNILSNSFQLRIAYLPNPINIWRAIEDILPLLIKESPVQYLIIDGSKPRTYSQELKKVLRGQGLHIITLRTESSHARPSLRVADCIANITRLHHEGSSEGASKLYKLISKRIEVSLKK